MGLTIIRGRLDKGDEQRMRVLYGTLVLGMVLYADEPRVVFQFDHFDQVRVGIDADRFEPGFGEFVEIVVVEFITVAVTLDNCVFP